MSKKRKNELMGLDEEERMPDTTTEQKFPTLDDYFMPQKVQAFCDHYMPVEEQTMQSEVFTEARLREFFKAYHIPSVGDPLTKYLDALAAHGIIMSVTIAGEPAIIVVEKY